MPRMNGVQAALILKQMLRETPILLLTSHSDALKDRGALLRGVDASSSERRWVVGPVSLHRYANSSAVTLARTGSAKAYAPSGRSGYPTLQIPMYTTGYYELRKLKIELSRDKILFEGCSERPEVRYTWPCDVYSRS
jgi:CheY-like chemotaxis protein